MRSVKSLIWSTAAVFHNVVEALAQKCDGDQCSLYLLGCRLTLINVWRRCINLRTIRALFGGLYFKLCHWRCRYIVLVANGPSLLPLCHLSAALLYIITYHKWTRGKWQGRHLQRRCHHLFHPLTFIKRQRWRVSITIIVKQFRWLSQSLHLQVILKHSNKKSVFFYSEF